MLFSVAQRRWKAWYDIKGKRRWVYWVSEQQVEQRYKVTYHTYLHVAGGGGQLSYSPSNERVDG